MSSEIKKVYTLKQIIFVYWKRVLDETSGLVTTRVFKLRIEQAFGTINMKAHFILKCVVHFGFFERPIYYTSDVRKDP